MTQANLEILRDELADVQAEIQSLQEYANKLQNRIDELTDYNGGADNER